MEPVDIGRIVGAAAPVVSPDGSTVAFVVARIDLDANHTRTAVWLAAADGSSPPYQFTAGEHGDSGPVWSPDGRRLAFTSRRAEGEGGSDDRKATLHVAPVTVPGEVLTLATRDEGIESLAWSPDGRRIAFASRQRLVTEDDDRARPPRRIDRLFSRIDGEGWIVDRPQHIFVVSADGSGPPRQVTDGPFEDSVPTWSPGSDRLAFLSARQADWDMSQANDVWVLSVDEADTEPVRVSATDRSIWFVSWAPDDDRLAVIVEDAEVSPSNAHIAVLDAADRSIRELTTALDRTCAPYPGVRPPVWDGDDLLFTVEDRGAVHIYRVGANGAEAPTLVVGGRRTVTGFDLAGGTLAFTATSPTTLPEVFVAEEDVDAGRRLTTVTAGFHADCPALEPQHFTVDCGDGTGEIDAWIVVPDGVDPTDATARHPMLLSVHGGPHTQYGERWFDEFQLWASAGYVVVYANPRGSSGRHQDWGRATRSSLAPDHPGSGWGGADVEDLLAVVDVAVERYPCVDPARLGVMGGSYGGYMASWLIGHDDRFRSACSERAVNNLLTLETASDAAGFFRFVFGISHLDHPEEYLARSPISAAADIHTPVLILHSENDLRCPVEQADQLFVALRTLGREFEYHRFPAEGHELSRSGSPKHRVQRAELILDWFARTLKDDPAVSSTS